MNEFNHILNNLPKKYDIILDGLENCLMATRDNALTMESNHKKLNDKCKKIKSKKEEKIKKEIALDACNKQQKQLCRKCGKYGHKPVNRKCPENKNEKEENNMKTERYDNKNRKFEGMSYHCSQN